MSEIYSIFVATDHLEKIYIRDLITAEEYYTRCSKLITQYKTAVNILGRDFDIHRFLGQYCVNMVAAQRRLVEVGVPATIEHAVTSTQRGNSSDAIYIAKAVEVIFGISNK